MVGKKSKKRTREQATKGNSGISPPNKRAGTAKTVRRRSNAIQTTISEWVLDEELPISQYSSVDPHTQKLLTHTNTQQSRSPPRQITSNLLIHTLNSQTTNPVTPTVHQQKTKRHPLLSYLHRQKIC